MSIKQAMPLKKGREGFTLIELLIVITIIGILAAIALPKFNRVRERAHFKAMMSDMRNLQAQQELYFSKPASNYNYSSNAAALAPFFAPSEGVDIVVTEATAAGWAATSAHGAMVATNICAVFVGTVSSVPAPALTPGVIMC